MPDQDISLVRLLTSNGEWNNFEADWRSQCDALGEDFESYAEATFTVVRSLIEEEEATAGVFGLRIDGKFAAMAQLNTAGLPKYDSPVLRVRYITFSPEYDLLDNGIEDYGDVLVDLLLQVLMLSRIDNHLKARHIKYHLRSPSDQQFFRALGRGLQERNIFESIQTRGAWLYISRKQQEP